uniref:ABC transporter permease subunit n=1 Tax=Aeromonas veronii TaxID=654 RepID=UPI003D201FD0
TGISAQSGITTLSGKKCLDLWGQIQSALLVSHTARNGAIPAIAYLSVQLVTLIEGVVVVESLFAYPGIGHALVHAIIDRDVPMLQGAVLVMSLLFIAISLLTDMASRWLNPLEGREHGE